MSATGNSNSKASLSSRLECELVEAIHFNIFGAHSPHASLCFTAVVLLKGRKYSDLKTWQALNKYPVSEIVQPCNSPLGSNYQKRSKRVKRDNKEMKIWKNSSTFSRASHLPPHKNDSISICTMQLILTYRREGRCLLPAPPPHTHTAPFNATRSLACIKEQIHHKTFLRAIITGDKT